MDITTDKLVKAYIKMRDTRAKLKAAYEEEDSGIKAQMEVIEQTLLETCKNLGAENIKTEFGTVIRSMKTHYWTGDWEQLHKFIRDNDALDLVERRVSQLNMKSFIRDNPDKFPPGLNVDNRYSVTIRRS